MTQTAHPDSVLIVDFGSQVTQLIARRVRESGVYCEIVPFQSAEEGFHRLKPKAIILSGSPASTLDEIQLVLRVRLLRVVAAWRIQLRAHAAVAQEFHEPLTGRAR